MFPIQRLLSKQTFDQDLLRIVLCALLFVHGAYRFAHGDTEKLAGILTEEGFPATYLLAFCVSFAETAGTALLLFRIMVLPVCASLLTIYITGVILFHWDNGFFVVGPGLGGWEYSALLITCLLTVIWQNRAQLFFPLHWRNMNEQRSFASE